MSTPIRQYIVSIANYPESYDVVLMAPTAGAAKYRRWLDAREHDPDLAITAMRARVLKTEPVEPDGFRRCVESRGIPFARIGMRVRLRDGRGGTIVGHNDSANLDIILDGDSFPSNCHPHDEIEYLAADGAVIEAARRAGEERM